jgi:hypothetical protein
MCYWQASKHVGYEKLRFVNRLLHVCLASLTSECCYLYSVGNGVRMHIRMNIRMLIRIPRRLVISAPAEAAWR